MPMGSYVGAYWGNRAEPVEECAFRIQACLEGLVSAHSQLGRWFHKGASRRSANRPIALDHESILRILLDGRSREDFGGAVIENLGFSFHAWNGESPGVGANALLGAHPSTRGIMNSFVLTLPPPVGESDELYDEGVAASIFGAIVSSMAPDWATWCSDELRDAQPMRPREPVIGWLTYLSSERVKAGDGDTYAQAFFGGVLLKAAETYHAADVRAVEAVRAGLRGSLGPIP
jgi:hypothetical protein